MTARLAYLTTPSPDRYVLNIQADSDSECIRYEITRAHLINILIDGTALALRESNNRVPETKTERTHERSTAGTQ